MKRGFLGGVSQQTDNKYTCKMLGMKCTHPGFALLEARFVFAATVQVQ